MVIDPDMGKISIVALYLGFFEKNRQKFLEAVRSLEELQRYGIGRLSTDMKSGRNSATVPVMRGPVYTRVDGVSAGTVH